MTQCGIVFNYLRRSGRNNGNLGKYFIYLLSVLFFQDGTQCSALMRSIVI